MKSYKICSTHLNYPILLFSFSSIKNRYNNQNLFLSSAKIAWVNFARDIGPGETDFKRFADVMLQMHGYIQMVLQLWNSIHPDM